MQIIPIDKDKHVKVDGDRAEVFYLTEVQKCLKDAEARLSELPPPPSDEQLLAWAKENFPFMDYSKEKNWQEGRVAEYKSILEAIK